MRSKSFIGKTCFASVLSICAVILSSCSNGAVQEDGSASTKVSPSATDASLPASVGASGSAEGSAVAARTALDQLLPFEVVEKYFPTFTYSIDIVKGQERSSFRSLDNVKPKKCAAVLQLQVTPDEDSEGPLASVATFIASPVDTGPTFTQRIVTFETPALAKEAYEALVEMLPGCRQSQGEFPQTGPIIIGDGISTVSIEASKIREASDTVTILQGSPSYDGLTNEMSALVLADASVMWLDSWSFDSTVSESKFLAKFDNFVSDAQAYALTGEVPVSAPEPNAELALDCLRIEAKPFKLIKNYDRYYGRGQGNDLFIEQQFSVTNNCGKAVRAFKYDVVFADELGEVVEGLSGANGSEKMSIPDGQTKTTPKNQGWILDSFGEDAAGIKTMVAASPGDITVTAEATLIRFGDGTTLP